MTDKGWIKLHRQIQDNNIWLENSPFDRRSAWIDLIMMANIQNKEIIYRGKVLTIKRGQVYTSIRKLADRWHWSRDKVGRFVNLLEKTHMIRRDNRTTYATLITIVNYSVFQDVHDSHKDSNKDTHKDSNKDSHKALLKNIKNDKEENVSGKLIVFALISCLCNAVSGVMDKFITRTVEPTALQFWYMLFLVIYYIIYVLVTREKIAVRKDLCNYWIWILAIMFVIGDKALFIANRDEASKAVIMTLIKQSSCVVTILAGKFIFKEKNIGYKLICLAIIVAGIMISAIF